MFVQFTQKIQIELLWRTIIYKTDLQICFLRQRYELTCSVSSGSCSEYPRELQLQPEPAVH